MVNTNVSSDSFNPLLKQAFIQLFVERTGFQIRENDQAVFKETVLKRTKAVGLSFPEQYYQLLTVKTTQSHREWRTLISEVTNTESFFFRDKGQFKLLKEHIIPSLIRKRAANKTLRICSAGCSTGEEPYSLAILLKQMIPDIQNWNLTILGVDINFIALEKAKAGQYRPWSFRGLEPEIKDTFFKKVDDNYYVDSSIKSMVQFQMTNLVGDSFSDLAFEIKDMDLILCRNVFIYFSKSAINTVLNKFHNALCPEGYLLVGHAELYNQNPKNFQIKMFEESVAYQRSATSAAYAASEFSTTETVVSPYQRVTSNDNNQELSESLEINGIKMQHAAMNLLRNLPGDTRIPKMGNLTAAELLFQYEQTLNKTD